MKTERLIAILTAGGSPTRAESEPFGYLLTLFGQHGHFLWSGAHFVIYKYNLEPLKPCLLPVIENREVDGQCDSC